jgi:hypothetical protein
VSYQGLTGLTRYLSEELFPVDVNNKLDMTALRDEQLFNPVVPLFEKSKKEKKPTSSSSRRGDKVAATSSSGSLKSSSSKEREKEAKEKEKEGSKSPRSGWVRGETSVRGSDVTPLGLVAPFIDELRRNVTEKFAELDKVFGSAAGFITVREARLVILLRLAQQLAQVRPLACPTSSLTMSSGLLGWCRLHRGDASTAAGGGDRKGRPFCPSMIFHSHRCVIGGRAARLWRVHAMA